MITPEHATIPTREGEREGQGNSDVARCAPHLDERADTATQLAEGKTESCGGVESRHAVDAAVVTSGNGDARRNTPLVTPASCGDQRPTVRCGSDETDPKKAAERSNTPVASISAGVAPGPQDLSSCGGDILAVHPLGAVAEGDSPQRVAPQNDDGLDIPIFLRRVVVAPASPAQLDEREGAAT